MEFRRKKAYHIVILEKDLVTNIEDYLKLLSKTGKYFYIYHHKDEVQPHYHIYYSHYSAIDEIEAEDFVWNDYVKRVHVAKAHYKSQHLSYMLQNGKYALSDIVTTMPLG